MLYLEDYLEMIEHLPQELRDRFTEMREMDLQVQNAMDSLDSRVKEFFAACKKMKQSERDTEYEKIDQDYYKALEDADEKVHIANQIYELLERYIRKLDQELQKFKMELEADNAGITEILEQRSYDLDKAQVISCPMPVSVNSIKAEKRKHSQISSSLNYNNERQGERSEKVLSSLANEVIRETIPSNRITLTTQSLSTSSLNNSSTNVLPEKTVILAQSKSNPFGGGNALAAAASQAIAATQQSLKRSSNQNQSNLSQQGRRSASLKASYEAINSGLTPTIKTDFSICSRDMTSMQPVVTNSNVIASSLEPKTKTKKTSRSATASQSIETSLMLEDSGDSSTIDDTPENVDWNYDPNEPRYCICNQVSYGDMVACDNTDCPFEWFHYQCVGISQPPKGKWYCPQCTSSMRRRGRKDR